MNEATKLDLARLEALAGIRPHLFGKDALDYYWTKSAELVRSIWTDWVMTHAGDYSHAEILTRLHQAIGDEEILWLMDTLHNILTDRLDDDPAVAAYVVGWNTALTEWDDTPSNGDAAKERAAEWAIETFPNKLDRSRLANGWHRGYAAGLIYAANSVGGVYAR